MCLTGRCDHLRRLLVGGLVLLALASCGGEQPAVPPRTQSYPTSEATDATTVFLTGPVVTTKIRSGRIIYFAERDSSWAFVLVVDFFDEQGKHSSILHADSALVREKQRLLEVFGAVRIETDDGRTLVTDHLAWDDDKRTIGTDAYVEITHGEDVMRGYGFASDPELTHIRLRRRVTGRLTDTKTLKDTL